MSACVRACIYIYVCVSVCVSVRARARFGCNIKETWGLNQEGVHFQYYRAQCQK